MTADKLKGLLVPGIDGNTPLGFLAALGLLQILHDTKLAEHAPPRLAWQQLDAWRPVVYGVESIEELSSIVLDDSSKWAGSQILGFNYVKVIAGSPKLAGGLGAPLSVVRAWSSSQRSLQDEASLAYAAALFTDSSIEINDDSATAEDHRALGIDVDPSMPIEYAVNRTFLDFTARNAQFLDQVRRIRDYLSIENILNALDNGRPDNTAVEATRTLDWDPSSDMPPSIYTSFRRGFMPVHEWLGFRALRLFPLASRGTRVRMTACTGRRLDGTFTWPLWETSATIHSVYSLLGYPQLAQLTANERSALGISALLCAGLTKKADRYTGTFAPARPT